MQPVVDKFSDPVEGSTKYSHVKLADRVHIEAFIGILYLRAAFRWNILDREIIWNHESAHDIIGPTMSLNRFKFICRLITFDNKETQIDRWKADKFACMRDLFEDMNDRNGRIRYPSLLLAIDETFYPYRGHIGFKRYSPSKPAKYGLLYRSVCNFSITYTYYSLPYAGKPEKVEGPAFADESSKFLINELPVYCNLQEINISTDCCFTSVSLAKWALYKNITIISTMKHDQKGIPKKLKPVADREERSVMHVYNTKEKIMLVSYTDKKSGEKKL